MRHFLKGTATIWQKKWSLEEKGVLLRGHVHLKKLLIVVGQSKVVDRLAALRPPAADGKGQELPAENVNDVVHQGGRERRQGRRHHVGQGVHQLSLQEGDQGTQGAEEGFAKVVHAGWDDAGINFNKINIC